jgi:hypothetical protein
MRLSSSKKELKRNYSFSDNKNFNSFLAKKRHSQYHHNTSNFNNKTQYFTSSKTNDFRRNKLKTFDDSTKSLESYRMSTSGCLYGEK